MSETRNIIIIGGGYGGVDTYLNLLKQKLNDPNIRIILISNTDYFYHNIASPRAVIDKNIIPEISIPFDKIFTKKQTQFIHGLVTSISENQIKYQNFKSLNEETINFEYLILALGSKYGDPFNARISDHTKQINHQEELYEKMVEAKKVLIIGAGAVGVELAGEISEDCPDKKVILVSSKDKILPNLNPKASKIAKEILLSRQNVQIILNDRVDLSNLKDNFKIQNATTKNGLEIEFDTFFNCIGSLPNTELIKNSKPDWLDQKGFIQVNKNLQVLKSENIKIFSLGDCSDVNEEKMAINASKHAEIIAGNIKKLLSNKRNLKPYNPSNKLLMIVTIGRKDAILNAGSITISGCIPARLKARDLFTTKFRKMLGYS